MLGLMLCCCHCNIITTLPLNLCFVSGVHCDKEHVREQRTCLRLTHWWLRPTGIMGSGHRVHHPVGTHMPGVVQEAVGSLRERLGLGPGPRWSLQADRFILLDVWGIKSRFK